MLRSRRKLAQPPESAEQPLPQARPPVVGPEPRSDDDGNPERRDIRLEGGGLVRRARPLARDDARWRALGPLRIRFQCRRGRGGRAAHRAAGLRFGRRAARDDLGWGRGLGHPHRPGRPRHLGSDGIRDRCLHGRRLARIEVLAERLRQAIVPVVPGRSGGGMLRGNRANQRHSRAVRAATRSRPPASSRGRGPWPRTGPSDDGARRGPTSPRRARAPARSACHRRAPAGRAPTSARSRG